MYITAPTNISYRFPLFNNSSSFGTISSNWGDNLFGGNSLFETIFNSVKGGVYGIGEVSNLIGNASAIGANLINSDENIKNQSAATGNILELPKNYNYPKDGDSITVNFTLYNTTKKDAWKQNYNFLALFCLRNLPVRVDQTSFLPPLLYDVTVPGSKRLPICATSEIKVTAKGTIRLLSCKNPFKGLGKEFDQTKEIISVNVPEAWEVVIVFKSLIAPSANLMLAGASNSKITTSSSGGNVTISSDVDVKNPFESYQWEN